MGQLWNKPSQLIHQLLELPPENVVEHIFINEAQHETTAQIIEPSLEQNSGLTE